MWKNKWKKLKKYNKEQIGKLKPENKKYIDNVIGYICCKGVGMLEGEVIRRDLIGIAKKQS